MTRPVIAAAAAIAGLIKCVLLPGPCRPLKFLLLVEAHLSPGGVISPFIPTHIEQPVDRQSKPASIKSLSNPSASACFFIRVEPGTIIAGTSAFLP